MNMPLPPKQIGTFRDRKWREQVARSSGTVDLSGYVPYTGALSDVNLGTKQLFAAGATVDSLAAQSAAIDSAGITSLVAALAQIDGLTVGNAAGASVAFDGPAQLTLDWDGTAFDVAIASSVIATLTNSLVTFGVNGTKDVGVRFASATSGNFFEYDPAGTPLDAVLDYVWSGNKARHLRMDIDVPTWTSGNWLVPIQVDATASWTGPTAVGLIMDFDLTDTRNITSTAFADYFRINDWRVNRTAAFTSNQASTQKIEGVYFDIDDSGSYTSSTAAGIGATIYRNEYNFTGALSASSGSDYTAPFVGAQFTIGVQPTTWSAYYDALVKGTTVELSSVQLGGMFGFEDVDLICYDSYINALGMNVGAPVTLDVIGYRYGGTSVGGTATSITGANTEYAFQALRSGMQLAANGTSSATDYSGGIIRLGVNNERIYSDGTDLVLYPQTTARIKGHLAIDDAKNISFGTSTGTKIGTSTSQKLAFYNATPVVQQSALTTQLTTITHTAPGTPDYAIATMPSSASGAVYGFSTQDEAHTVLSVIANLQTRVAQLETRLKSYGLLP